MSHRNILSLLTVILLAGGLAAILANAQNTQPANTAENQPRMGMMNQAQWMDMMKQMGMSDGMMMRCRMMTAANVDAYDPASVLAYQTGLNLSTEQVKQIQAIADKAREQVKAVLTAEQIAKLQSMVSGPQNMTQMCQYMEQMRQKHGGNWNSGMMMTCPMMWTPATQPADVNAPPQQQNSMMWCPMNCW
jgi:hypothetical protein